MLQPASTARKVRGLAVVPTPRLVLVYPASFTRPSFYFLTPQQSFYLGAFHAASAWDEVSAQLPPSPGRFLPRRSGHLACLRAPCSYHQEFILSPSPNGIGVFTKADYFVGF